MRPPADHPRPPAVHCGALLCALVALVVVCPHPARADRLVLNNGRVLEGVVDDRERARVSIRTSSGQLTFPRDMVARVERDAPAVGKATEAQIALTQGQYSRAISLLAPSAVPSDSERAKVDDLLAASAEDVVRTAPSVPRAEAVRLERHILDRPAPAAAPLLCLLGRIRAARGDLGGSVDAWATVPEEYWPNNPEAAAHAVPHLEKAVTRLLQDGDNTRALAAVRVLAAASPQSRIGGMRATFELAEAERLTAAGRFHDALSLLGSLARTAPGLALQAARRSIDQARGTTSTERLAILLDHANSLLPGKPVNADLLALGRDRVTAWIDAGDLDRAQEAADDLSLADADTGAREVHRVGFARRRAAIRDDDLLARYELAGWAAAMGLDAEARAEYRAARTAPDLRENADLQLELLEMAGQREEFARIAELYRAGRHADTIREAEAFRRRHPSGDFHREAGSLMELSRYSLQRGSALQLDRSIALLQNAERLHLQGRNREALEVLTRVQADFAGTAAAKRAAQVRAQVEAAIHRDSAAAAPPPPVDPEQARQAEEIRRLAEKLTGKSL